MFALFSSLFTQFVYQPFFNLLILIDLGLGKFVGQPDMGWSVIIFTLIFRIIILPLSLNAGRSEKEKYEIGEKFKQIQKLNIHDPIKMKEEKRKLVRTNKLVILSESFDIFIQVMIALMLYRMFTTGLEGADFHLLYKFIPQPIADFNLTWMNQYDLTKPNIQINILNTIVIFAAEFFSMRFSPFPLGKNEKATLIILPLGAYIFFAQMPAGKKLFVVTTLLFSIMLMLTRRIAFYLTKTTPLFQGWAGSFKSQIKKQ